MRFVAIDFETTGLSAKTDRVIEVGVVRFSKRGIFESEFSTLINPRRDVGRVDIHGITPTMLKAAPAFEEIVGVLCDLIDGAVLVAHNKRFDLRFLRAELERSGFDAPELDALCTMELLRSAFPKAPRRLGDACSFLGIELDTAHEALADARMAAKIAISILKQHGYPAIPEVVSINPKPKIRRVALVARREASWSQEPSYLQRLIQEMPANLDSSGRSSLDASEYLNLLDRVIEDRIIDEEESAELVSLALELGLSTPRIEALHRDYVTELCAVAREDGVVTDGERRDVEAVALLLGISDWAAILDADQVSVRLHESEERSMPIGTRVCFTGQMDLPRDQCEEMAQTKGFVVCPSVTKAVEVLVVADPHSQSRKAQTARKYGARIISERAFFAEIRSY